MPKGKKTANPDEVYGDDTNDANEIVLDLEEAFLVILLLANDADGEVAPEERQALAVTLERMNLFKYLSPEEIEEMFERTSNIFEQYSVDTIFDAVKKTLPMELRETAFAAATYLVFADGIVTEEEGNFLGQLWGDLEISDETAQKIIEVMEIMNRA
ncbi:MAG TPA: Tellurite resistance protein TerB [Cyanobacteria bacterium UBA11372]|nr:Tellurite resistance protein TerB [Cyanobacteria bacterium UBA11372]